MKSSIAILFLLAACAPTAPSTSTDYVNTNAEFSGNVSALYALIAASTGAGVDVKWRDATGLVHRLSDYQGSKPVVLAFGTSSDATAETQFAALDSVRAEMGDSVRTLAIANDNTIWSFKTVSDNIASHHITGQVISDSARRVQVQFVQFSDGQLWSTESFVLGLDGKIVSGGATDGLLEDKASFETLVRKAYHP
jgi:peroxiredoxin